MSLRKELKILANLAWPIILGNMSHIIIGIIDSVMIGRLGKVPLAACTFANAIMGFVIISSVGMTSVIAPLVAQELGRKNAGECGQIWRHGLVLNSACGLFFLSIILILTASISAFDQPLEVQPLAKTYLLYLAPSIFFIVGINVCRQFSEGLSLVRPMLIFAGLSIALNAFLNWLFIFGNLGFPALGLDGAGIATTLTRLIVFLGVLLFILKHPFYKPYLAKFKLQKSLLLRQLKLGIPGSLQYTFESAAFTGAAILMGWVGTVALAAHQIVINLAALAFMVALGTSVAVSVRVGEAVGEGNISVARKRGFTGIAFAVSFMIIAGFIFYFARESLARIYINDADVIAMASTLLIIAAFFQIFDGTQGVAIGALRGLPDVFWPTVITFVAYWVISLPLGYLLAFKFGLGGPGIWWGMATGLLVSATLLTCRFYFKTNFKPPLQTRSAL